MNDKTHMLTMLREEFNRWEELLTGSSEEQIIASNRIAQLSIKDVIAHLRAWQQVSIARLEAALHNQEPEFPPWLGGLHPESEEQRDQYNECIYRTYCEQSWTSVHQVWRAGFLRFLELAEALPEEAWLAVGRYPWLEKYPLLAVLQGSYGHHAEHFELFVGLLRSQGN